MPAGREVAASSEQRRPCRRRLQPGIGSPLGPAPGAGCTQKVPAHKERATVCQMGPCGGAEEETGEGQAVVISLPRLQSKAAIKEGRWFKVLDLVTRVPGHVCKCSHRSRCSPGCQSAKTTWKGKAESKHGPVCARGAGMWPPVPRPLLAPPWSPQCQAARRDAPASPAPVQRRRGAEQKHRGEQKAMPQSHSCLIQMFLAFEKA